MNDGFKMRYDKNTIDHLGIKLYSTFPPVIAELISNAYDADAENVKVTIDYDRKFVTVEDDGLGMTHEELNGSFLVIGRNRRVSEGTGLSPIKKRKITGKKGLGKLAAFGIAKTIEVHSIKNSMYNAFRMNYDDLKAGTDGEYYPEAIAERETTEDSHGTKICIREISQSNIMPIEDLSLNLSKRFSFYDTDFNVILINKNKNNEIPITKSIYFENLEEEFKWTFPDDFENEIIDTEEFNRLNEKGVNGTIYTKPTPLKKSETGFLLYVRNKLASENTFFNDRSNDRFNGYVTGFFNIDYIDESDSDDFISTARQSILWEDSAETILLKTDLDKLVSKVSNLWRMERKEKREKQLVLDEDFFKDLSPTEVNNINKIKNVLMLNTDDTDEIESVKKILESVKNLYKFESFQEYVNDMTDEDLTVENIQKIANDWEYIESKELAKIAVGRIKAIEKFEEYVKGDSSEVKVIQPFLEKFPWILDPRITTFEREIHFSRILKENFPDDRLDEPNRRLDFLCNKVNHELLIIELKRPSIKISLDEIRQAREYERFISKNHKDAIEKGVKTFLISDRYDMNDEARDFYTSLEKDDKLYIKSYSDLLDQAKNYNQEFINKYNEVQEAYNGT